MRLSPSRVTSAVRPSGVSATWLGPDFSSPRRTLPAGVTVLPLIVNTETVPSLRFAARARLPCRLIEMPATPAPASSVAMTRIGEDCRSITETLLSLAETARWPGPVGGYASGAAQAPTSSRHAATESVLFMVNLLGLRIVWRASAWREAPRLRGVTAAACRRAPALRARRWQAPARRRRGRRATHRAA